VVVLDKELKITTHNNYLSKLLLSKKNIVGNPIHNFILPESHKLLPLLDSTKAQSVRLIFTSSDSAPMPLQCDIFKIDNSQHLLIGGHFMLTNEQMLQEMTIMLNEMANMTRDINRKNRTTVHTGPYTAIRLVKTGPNNITGLFSLGERNATSISATAALYQ